MFDSSRGGSDPPSSGVSLWSGGQSSLVSIAALHKALDEQKEALNQKSKQGKVSFTSGSITVRLSLGKVFQKLELAFPDIYTHIYKHKVLYHPLPYQYSYQLCGEGSAPNHAHTPSSSEGSMFSKLEATFQYYGMEDYNWNYLDQHVLGWSEFDELQEVVGVLFEAHHKNVRACG